MNFDEKTWENHKSSFSTQYDKSNYANSIQSWVMGKSHQLLERSHGKNVFFEKVLEIGAGTGEHFRHIKHNYREYIFSDSSKEMIEVINKKFLVDKNPQLRCDIQLAEQLTYNSNTFDRVIATHVLEHIYPPHLALKEWSRVLKDGGILSLVIPTDPGVLWKIGRYLGPRKNSVDQGIPYDYLMAREHINSCTNLMAIIRHHFPNARDSWWPTMIPSVDLNLFCAINIQIYK